MNFQDAIQKVQDAITVERVFGKPYERDGVVVIPAARVSGAGGGGGGEDAKGGGSGSGGGFRVGARPVGAYVIENGRLRWEPATDVTRLVAQLAAIAVGAVLALRATRGG